VVDVGKPAPDFTLLGEGNKDVSLADFKGKNLVLFFFPKAFTGTCERQVSEHAARIEDFAALNANIVGVSTDQMPTLLKFAEQCEAAGKVTLLSDFRHRAIQSYGIAIETGPTPNQRAVFIIDGEGVLRYEHVEAAVSQYQGVGPELEVLRSIEG
jgi:peroxiredoxin